MQLSAIVVTFNDEDHLEKCLSQLIICDQLIVVDLGSSDNSPAIAKKYATSLLTHAWEPIAEFVLSDVIDIIENDWIIRADPDEYYPTPLLKSIMECIRTDNCFSNIEIPFQYYFQGRPLKRTVWGGVRYFGNKIINIKRVNFYDRVHGSIEPHQGTSIGRINYTEKNIVKHYWIDSYKDLFEKHNRYLKLEGKSRFERGERFSLVKWFYTPFVALYDGLIRKGGIIGRPEEIFLSFFYAWYISKSLLALRDYSKKLIKKP